MDNGPKYVLYAGALVATGAVGYGIYKFLTSSSFTNDCSSPSSACYAAIKPQVEQLNQCMAIYTTTADAYIKANPTGLNAAQIATLHGLYMNCVTTANDLSKNAANQNPLLDFINQITPVLGNIMYIGTVITLGSVLGPRFIGTLRLATRTAADAFHGAWHAIVRARASDGTLRGLSADWLASVQDLGSYYIADIQTEFAFYLGLGAITDEAAVAALISDEVTAILIEQTLTEDAIIIALG